MDLSYSFFSSIQLFCWQQQFFKWIWYVRIRIYTHFCKMPIKISIFFQSLNHLDPNFFLMFNAFLYWTGHLYAYCYVGKYSTDYFLAFADCIVYESNWININSLKLKKSLPMMIAHAQIPLYYHGFHMVNLNLELFLKVWLSSITFLVLFFNFFNFIFDLIWFFR